MLWKTESEEVCFEIGQAYHRFEPKGLRGYESGSRTHPLRFRGMGILAA